jgi:hypothetical protein
MPDKLKRRPVDGNSGGTNANFEDSVSSIIHTFSSDLATAPPVHARSSLSVDGEPVYLVSNERQEQQIDRGVDNLPTPPIGHAQVEYLPANVKNQKQNRTTNNVHPAAGHIHDLAA